MKKVGGVLVIMAIVLGSLAVIAISAGVYFYNFHVFKEVRLCLGESTDTEFECSMVQDCFDKADEIQTKYNFSELPDFAIDLLDSLADEAVYCEDTCKVRNIRGINLETYELEDLEFCDAGEKEVVLDIRGKEGIQIWNFVKGLE